MWSKVMSLVEPFWKHYDWEQSNLTHPDDFFIILEFSTGVSIGEKYNS